MNKVIGLDLGTNTLGIAVSDTIGIAHPRETFCFKHNDFNVAAAKVISLCNEVASKEIAIGLPLRLNGTTSPMSENVENFIKMLLEIDANLLINKIDERLTTVSAHRAINELGLNHDKRKAVVDQISACEILDTYLRRKENSNA